MKRNLAEYLVLAGYIAAILAVLSVWGLLTFVVYHFVHKYW
jgi:uncharacterized membrane protein